MTKESSAQSYGDEMVGSITRPEECEGSVKTTFIPVRQNRLVLIPDLLENT